MPEFSRKMTDQDPFWFILIRLPVIRISRNLRSTTIEPQSTESMDTNDGDVQSFSDQTLRVNRSTIRIEIQASESMNAKQSSVRCSNARILQINDRPGPLLVHLNQIQ